MPLADAAYYLWIQRDRLDHEDGRIARPPIKPTYDLSTPTGFREVVQRALLDILKSKQLASTTQGSTFSRLKEAHPRSSDRMVSVAITNAIAFESAYHKHFDSKNDNHSEAIAAARREFPDFEEQTYRDAYHQLRFEMR